MSKSKFSTPKDETLAENDAMLEVPPPEGDTSDVSNVPENPNPASPGKATKGKPQDEPPKLSATRRKMADAGNCPKNAGHSQTKVYKTEGKTRYCKCNDCGATWTVAAGYADPGRDFLDQLASELEEIPRQPDSRGDQVVVLLDSEARQIAAKLREIAKSSS